MDEELETYIAVPAMSVRHQFVRMILASAAGFLAHKLVENVYDAYYEKRHEIEVNLEEA